MRSHKFGAGALALLLASASSGVADGQSGKPRFGKPISEGEIAAWNIDVRTPDGKNLPSGKGSVGSMYGSMVGGIGSFTTNTRVLTPGSMYPYAPILFDYVRRTMPMTAPQSLTNDQVYALAAYLLNLNGLVPDTAVMDAESLTKVMMPNRNGFIPDDRPDTSARRCMTNC